MNAITFKKSYGNIIRSAEMRVDEIRKDADSSLEALAIECFGQVDSHEDDGFFGPPKVECEVECWHCGDRYLSGEMIRAYRPRMQGHISEAVGNGFRGLTPLWWCKNDDCDGAGFGHDIHPFKPRKKKSKRAQEGA